MEDLISEKKRVMRVAVISDTHLGANSCKAKELLQYLKSIKPEHLVLNGDIFDFWQFKKSNMGKSQMRVVRQIIKMSEKGTLVHYIPGNHDEGLRRFAEMSIGNIRVVNKMVLNLNGQKTWIFHGDVFDVFMHDMRWLAKLGAHGYALLTTINKISNKFLQLFGFERFSMSKTIKNRTKQRQTLTSRFEETVANLAIRKGYSTVICGHIHRPDLKSVETKVGRIQYINSGDWVENLTAAEYYGAQWHLYHYEPEHYQHNNSEEEVFEEDIFLATEAMIFKSVVMEVIESN